MPKRNSSVQNALRILGAFSKEETDFGITELSKKLGLGKSTVHRLLTTLSSEGFIAQDTFSKRYHLGISTYSVGQAAVTQFGLNEEVRKILAYVTKATGESSNIGILEEDEFVNICRHQNSNPSILKYPVGDRVPAYCTASGQVLLSYLDEEELERVVAKGFIPFTAYTITSKQKLYDRLKEVKKQGYSVAINELHNGFSSLAVPIVNHNNKKVVTALSITGPNQRLTSAKITSIIKILTRASHEIAKAQTLHSQQLA
jgi:DNA-binding IclR family transcriptional regulator